MNLNRRNTLKLAAASMLCTTGAARASRWPDRTIRFIVPFAPGGSSDIAARMVTERLGRALGQTVVVDYKPGANGNLGADYVSRSGSDAHTFLVTDIVGLAISPSVYPKMSFDPMSDLQCVGMLTFSPHILAANPSVKANNIRELAALSKQEHLNLATSSIGSSAHLAALQIQLGSQAQWEYIPYKGGAPAINDTVANQTQLLVIGLTSTMPMVKAGKLKPLAVTSTQRMKQLPEIQTVSESGLAGFLSGTYQGIMAPANLPAEIAETVNQAIRQILQEPDVQAAAAAQSSEVLLYSRQKMDPFYKQEARRWGDIARKNNVSAV